MDSQNRICRSAIGQALVDGEFSVFYQPQFGVADGKMVGMEALMRWQHDGRNISPEIFIPAAERTGEIIALGEWVLRTAIRHFIDWSVSHPEFQGALSVNISPRQIGPALVPMVRNVLSELDFPAYRLEMEVTESMAVGGAAIAVMRDLAQMGIRIALDDFGAGYSSLSSLTRFPLSILKIDRSFMLDLPKEPGNIHILEAVVTMAKSLSLQTIVEGIETRGMLNLVREVGVDAWQGFLATAPVPVQTISSRFLPSPVFS